MPYSFTSSAWIDNLLKGGGSTWSVATTVDLRTRPDNSTINSSPTSGTAPIIRLQQSCTYTLPIHVDDPDGDVVRCRWAQNGAPDKIIDDPSFSNDECGGVCEALEGAILDNVRFPSLRIGKLNEQYKFKTELTKYLSRLLAEYPFKRRLQGGMQLP